jgi:cytochrome b561
MTPPDQTARYGTVAVALHWTVAACLVAAVALGLTMAQLERGPSQDQLFAIHKSVGLLILLLMLGRISWRVTHTPPAMPPMSRLQYHLARATHVLLYVIAVVMPVSGYVAVAARGRDTVFLGIVTVPRWVPMDRALAHTAETIHVVSQYALYALVAGHVAAALHHQFIVRDDLLRRMWPARRSD